MELRSGTKIDIILSEQFNMPNMSGDEFKLNFIESLKDKECAAVLADVISQANLTLFNEIQSLKKTVTSLKEQIKAKDTKIQSLEKQNSDLEIRLDDLEQYSRRGSIRIYGIDEETPGSTDDKVLDLINNYVALKPPLDPNEIEVSHRVGKSDDPASKPRAMLVKFVSRRTKNRVMNKEVRKKLKTLPVTKKKETPVKEVGAEEDGNDEEVPAEEDINETPKLPDLHHPIFFGDDLTKRRATLAYLARLSKRDERIQDTWVSDGKILIKDWFAHIYPINSEADLTRYEQRIAKP